MKAFSIKQTYIWAADEMSAPLPDLALELPAHLHGLLMDSADLAAALCIYLTTSRADFLRGRFISANWDVTELEARRQEIIERDLLKLSLAV